MTTISNIQRVIGLRGTKAQMEAFTATMEEQAIAYATDTESFGIYTNGAWVWFLLTPDYSAVNASELATRFEPLTNGDPASPELIFIDGDVVVTEVEN